MDMQNINLTCSGESADVTFVPLPAVPDQILPPRHSRSKNTRHRKHFDITRHRRNCAASTTAPVRNSSVRIGDYPTILSHTVTHRY